MAKGPEEAGTRIVVELGDLKLPANVEKQLETDIRRAVLSAIAGIDHTTDLRLLGRPRLPHGTIGIIMRPELER
jgi:hypothetical protein